METYHKMGKRGKNVRIDNELEQILDKMRKENDMSYRQASKEAARLLKETKLIKQRKIKF